MEQLLLRRVTMEDAAALAAIYAPFVLHSTVTFEYDAPDAAEFARRIGEIAPMYPFIAAEADGRIVGYAYAHRYAARAAYDWRAETSIYIEPAYSGRGVGRALYGALLRLLARQGVQTACAIVALPNPASVGMQEAFGFRLAGTCAMAGYKLGRWIDLAIYEKHLGAYEVPPAPVTPFAELDGDAVDAVLSFS